MALFNQQISDVRRFIEEKKKDNAVVREIQCPGSADQLLNDLAVSFNPDNQPFVVFKEDTFVELGNPLQGSASMMLWTRQSETVRDGKITVIGPDIPESRARSLPFAQVIMVAGAGLEEKDLVTLERASNLSHRLEGYMIRRTPGKLWSRVSNAAGIKGLSFKTVGAALMANYKMQFVHLDAIEVVFLTTSKADVDALARISAAAQDKSLSIRRLARSAGAAYECNDLNCGECPDQEACETIREVIVVRKKGKVSRIKVVRGRKTEGHASDSAELTG
ncbi:MAG: hypothetical protein HKP58_07290 [Desulfatitalea sp.]|nr:hypothetical protein [Desulfatitalea sp.]NNK00202.1 hypothetical protein [Desulfatitalea sp.]